MFNKNFKKRLLYKYIYAESGLRRELLFLAQNDFNFICLVPVRKFETFYFSKVKGVFNSTEIKDLFIKEAWDQWYHKTSDYLYLKRKFPKKIILLPFEDFANISKRKKSVKKLLKLLNLKFYKINLITTHYKKKVLPNSSFKEKVDSYRKKNLKKEFGLSFPEEKLPVKYKKFYKKLRKKFY